MNPWTLDLSNVSKSYSRGVYALGSRNGGVDLRVGKGEVFGLLGPNGAGKSTLVKILTTVIRPTSASGTLLGNPIGHKPTLARVGYLPEHHRFPDYLTGRQVVDFFGDLSGGSRAARKARGDELLDFVGMRSWADQPIQSYSKGMRQRVGIAQALVNNPEFVILDEPTDGVDPVGRKEIREILMSLKARGTTVFINSHLLRELELVCDRVAILVKGALAASGTLDELTRDSRRYEVVVLGPPPTWALEAGLSTKPAGESSTMLSMGTDDPELVQPMIDRLRAQGTTIVSITKVQESLEDLFMRAVIDPRTGRAAEPGADRSSRGGRS